MNTEKFSQLRLSTNAGLVFVRSGMAFCKSTEQRKTRQPLRAIGSLYPLTNQGKDKQT
jgi:hypothetical protein